MSAAARRIDRMTYRCQAGGAQGRQPRTRWKNPVKELVSIVGRSGRTLPYRTSAMQISIRDSSGDQLLSITTAYDEDDRYAYEIDPGFRMPPKARYPTFMHIQSVRRAEPKIDLSEWIDADTKLPVVWP